MHCSVVTTTNEPRRSAGFLINWSSEKTWLLNSSAKIKIYYWLPTDKMQGNNSVIYNSVAENNSTVFGTAF